jgi:hypothetical protein
VSFAVIVVPMQAMPTKKVLVNLYHHPIYKPSKTHITNQFQY